MNPWHSLSLLLVLQPAWQCMVLEGMPQPSAAARRKQAKRPESCSIPSGLGGLGFPKTMRAWTLDWGIVDKFFGSRILLHHTTSDKGFAKWHQLEELVFESRELMLHTGLYSLTISVLTQCS